MERPYNVGKDIHMSIRGLIFTFKLPELEHWLKFGLTFFINYFCLRIKLSIYIDCNIFISEW